MSRYKKIILFLVAVAALCLFSSCVRYNNSETPGILPPADNTDPLQPDQPEPDQPKPDQPEPDQPEPDQPKPETPADIARRMAAGMELREKVCQLFITTSYDLTKSKDMLSASSATESALKEYPVGGIIYFADNITSAGQITSMIANTQRYSKIPLLIGIDEEGGRVSRLSKIGVTSSVSPMKVYGDAKDTDKVYELGRMLGNQIASVGFNLDFAPVADVITNPLNKEIGDRSFSNDPNITAKMVAAEVKGFLQSASGCCLKHFPGHGSTQSDSHLGMSVSFRTLDELRKCELIPFRAGIDAGADMIMISHMSAPNITGSNVPCDLSPIIVTDLLRCELGFEGIIITDAHNMGAITKYYECGDAAVQALSAGCDIILMPKDLDAAVTAVLNAVESGKLTESRIDESIIRILTMKCRLGIITE